MAELALIDNDVIFKMSCFNCVVEFTNVVGPDHAPRRLDFAPFVLRKKIAKSSRIGDKTGAQTRADALLAWAPGVEPTDSELRLAADIETIAQQLNLPFDSGESQLLAVHIVREASRLYTGDKRAIAGLPSLCERLNCLERVAGKVVCCEQIVLALLQILGPEELCNRVCREAEVDKTIAICCGCASGGSEEAEIAEGLGSYIRYLRNDSGRILASEDASTCGREERPHTAPPARRPDQS